MVENQSAMSSIDTALASYPDTAEYGGIWSLEQQLFAINPKLHETQALILAPTPKLALQTRGSRNIRSDRNRDWCRIQSGGSLSQLAFYRLIPHSTPTKTLQTNTVLLALKRSHIAL